MYEARILARCPTFWNVCWIEAGRVGIFDTFCILANVCFIWNILTLQSCQLRKWTKRPYSHCPENIAYYVFLERATVKLGLRKKEEFQPDTCRHLVLSASHSSIYKSEHPTFKHQNKVSGCGKCGRGARALHGPMEGGFCVFLTTFRFESNWKKTVFEGSWMKKHSPKFPTIKETFSSWFCTSWWNSKVKEILLVSEQN